MEINYSQFEGVDIRVGTIIYVDEFKEAIKPAYKITLDFGELGIKKSSAQITQYYKPSELIGKQIIAVVNFPSKQIADFKSECLILGVIEGDSGVVLLTTDKPVQNGLKIA
jgi:tRNA-binding protein